MAVIFVPKFNKQQITALLKDRRERIEKALISRLIFVGEKFVINARENGTYTDRTGNLRSSIGYVVIHNGQILKQNYQFFPRKDGKKRRPTGEKKGKEQAKQVIAEAIGNFPRGFVLIGVAGMDYAAAVESKGFDVITASSKQAESDLRKGLAELQKKIGKLK